MVFPQSRNVCMTQASPSHHTAITRISPVSIITANWIISIINKSDFITLTEGSIRYRYRGQLSAYISSHIQMPKQASHQLSRFYWDLDKVTLEILNLGLKERNAQRPEYMLPQIQLAIEPHYHALAKIYSADLLGRIF